MRIDRPEPERSWPPGTLSLRSPPLHAHAPKHFFLATSVDPPFRSELKTMATFMNTRSAQAVAGAQQCALSAAPRPARCHNASRALAFSSTESRQLQKAATRCISINRLA